MHESAWSRICACRTGGGDDRRNLAYPGFERGREGRAMQAMTAIAVQVAQAITSAELTPVTFDLATHKPTAAADLPLACRLRDPNEIVVCAQRRGGGNDYPIEKWAKVFATAPLVAETGIAPNTSMRAYVEQVEMPGGQVSKRAMVGVKLRF